MKYKCNCCHCEFDEPRVFYEHHGFTDGRYEHMSCCPCCGGDYEPYEEVDDKE